MALRFTPPPNWPKPPEGFTPPPGWQPDPAWGPAPVGWVFWVEDSKDAAVPPNPYVQNGSAQATPSFSVPPQGSVPPHAPQKKSKLPLILGIFAVVFLLIVAVVVGAVVLLSSANTAGVSSSPTFSSATNTSGESEASGESISNAEYQKAVENADPLPTSASTDNVKEYTADNIENTIKDAEPGQYMFGAQRPINNTDLAWAELIFTPSQEGTGYFSESRTTRLNEEGEPAMIEGHEIELKWVEVGKEYRHTFWLGPIIEGRNDIFEISLPEGSQWRLVIHPADHAPTVTGAVTSTTSGAFYYKPNDGKNIQFDTFATTDDASAELLVYYPESPTGTYLTEIEEINRGTAQSSKVTLQDSAVRVPINVTSTGTSWVFTPNP